MLLIDVAVLHESLLLIPLLLLLLPLLLLLLLLLLFVDAVSDISVAGDDNEPNVNVAELLAVDTDVDADDDDGDDDGRIEAVTVDCGRALGSIELTLECDVRHADGNAVRVIFLSLGPEIDLARRLSLRGATHELPAMHNAKHSACTYLNLHSLEQRKLSAVKNGFKHQLQTCSGRLLVLLKA
jgi:hypothetical protein